MIKKSWRKFLDIIFPKRCTGCKISGTFLCPKCASLIPPCEPIIPKWIISVWSYKDPRVKKLLWKFKFENKFSAGEDIARYVTEHLSDELSDRAIFENFQEAVLVPVPLTRKSLRKRGYNQSEILAREIASHLPDKCQVENLLIKTKDTETQHSIKNRRQRLQNLRGAYKVRDDARISGRNMIIIDDITTTHATLAEARRALMQGGARRVLAFTVAH